MRAIWSGAVTFGLVNVPVKLYSATESHDVPLHQVHDADGGRIKYERRCAKDGEVVPYEHIARAYDDGTHVVMLSDDDLKKLPAERNREIEVVEFVPSDQVDPIRFEKCYFLEPSDKSAKAYTLLRRTLESTDRTAIVQFALRQRTRLGALRVHGDALVLQALLWDDEVREASFPALESEAKVTDKELKLAQVVVESLEGDFDASAYVDEYQAELRQLIDAKLEKGDAVASFQADDEDKDSGGEVLDLMEALRRSVAKKRGGSASAADDAEDAEDAKPKATRRKTSTSKASTRAKSAPKDDKAPARRRKTS
ncbi:Ku protein [Luteimicrobium subarcticum]|uniref:Non-homologous end joining protein Ku n=1 Tax=Luteimicrobium subarcticum TaxID=620910 RepID=A0A2M8WR21_9MICO|nr:Ku protein [Luteimicrobium subarcticum]PJI93306.1 DNA end-binding protein Ku [Luteimicrobium subarcticum]